MNEVRSAVSPPRLPFAAVTAVLAAATLAVTACAPGDEAPAPWPGDWEGFVETSRQPVLLVAHLEETPDLEGVVSVFGRDLPMEGLEARGDSLQFTLQLGPQRLAFTGVRDGRTVTGDIVATIEGQDGESRFPFEAHRLPDFEPPSSRDEAWVQDLEHARSRFLRYDRSYSAESAAEARRILDDLDGRVAELDDAEIVVGLSRIAALADNAHTRFYLLRNRTALRRIPLRLWWFEDGLFVIGATEEWSQTLGCRVDVVGGLSATAARDSVSALFAANESWRDYKSTYFLTAPSIFFGLGIGVDSTAVTLDLECPDATRSLRIEAQPLVRLEGPTENWRNLSPRFEGEQRLLAGARWRAALSEEPPMYLDRPDVNYWFEPIEGSDALYIQYNRSQDDEDGESLSEFRERLLAELDRGPAHAIVDLRFNTGGDLSVARGLFDELGDRFGEGASHRLIALVGEATFSAGLFHAAQLRLAGATLIGREPGDRLDYWSEGGNIVLPNSGYTLHFANGYHSYSGTPRPDVARIFESLAVPSLTPDVEVRVRSAEYFSGRDPLLEAALETLSTR